MKYKYFDPKKDIGIVILDIIAVNVSYFLALVFRYCLRYGFIPSAVIYLQIFANFAPFYSVVCVVVFLLFKLYNGMWIYAGINDLNRIVLASVTASAIHLIGITVLFRRMPIMYYFIGAVIQIVLILTIRYSYRVVDIEKRKIQYRKIPALRLMLIGADDTAKKVLMYLENEAAFRPVVVVDNKSREASIHGLPVEKDAEAAMDQYKVKCVLIADPLLSEEKREALKDLCNSKGIELFDYTGFFTNITGNIALTELGKVIASPVKIMAGETTYDSLEQALQAITDKCDVVAVEGSDLVIKVQPSKRSISDGAWDEWMKQYKQETGEDVSFF